MSLRTPRRSTVGSTVLLAGWLFADLLLLLLLIALGSLPRLDRTAGKGATPSHTPGSSASPSQQARVGLVLKPCSFTVQTGSDDAVASQLASQLHSAGVQNRTAGFVLSFGSAPQPDEGQAAADRVNGIVTQRLKLFQHAPKRGYWQGGPTGSVRIDVFFLSGPDGDTSLPPGCHSSGGG
ncbi:hypothetical protein ABZ746_15365 [Streptomyces sp. NPDC020096]